MKNRGLGRGLSALLKEEVLSVDNGNETIKIINIDMIEAGIYQPRKKFEADKIQELAMSIADSGLLQPIIVTAGDGGKYKIVAGERRWRACRLAGVFNIPVIIKNYTNQEILKVSLLENIQREDISAIEEAEAFSLLIKEFHCTQEELSQMLGKSRSHIANLLRLNQLPDSVKEKIKNNQLSMGHARCLVGHDNAEQIAEYIVNNELNVRRTEDIVKNWYKQQSKPDVIKKQTKNKNQPEVNSNDSDLMSLIENLSEKFGVKVTIEGKDNEGQLIFHFENYNQLDNILSKLQ